MITCLDGEPLDHAVNIETIILWISSNCRPTDRPDYRVLSMLLTELTIDNNHTNKSDHDLEEA